jgi:NAD(P)H-hydrate epimerase
MTIEGHKVVLPHEMARIEGMAYAQGASELQFMENAGAAVAAAADAYAQTHALDKTVTLVVGKGNNGGDAYTAGRKLLEKGYSVAAWHIFSLDSCGPLCRQQHDLFRAAGGAVHVVHSDASWALPATGLILDGLVGTGFKGKAEGALAAAIQKINRSLLPVLAIDVPSGLDGATGVVATEAVRATQTIYLGLPKLGFFLNAGWDHVGALIRADFGLGPAFIDQAHAEAYLLDEASAPSLLPPIKRSRHKYERGYVAALAGSCQMSGAAILACYAALRAGAGIVRLFHPEGIEEALAAAPFEIIKEGVPVCCTKRIAQESARANAFLLGPGLGRCADAQRWIKRTLPLLTLPAVIDADALFFLARHPRISLPQNALLTPHGGEMERLLGKEPTPAACQDYVDQRSCTLVLKGAPTWIYHPRTAPLIIPRGDPGMAAAGTGDVLAGMLAAQLAQGLAPREAAALAVYMHALAGEAASAELTPYSVIASDLIRHLPPVIQRLRFLD